jgi:hypothetical protein
MLLPQSLYKVDRMGFVVVYEQSCTQPPSFEVHCKATIQHSASERLPNGSCDFDPDLLGTVPSPFSLPPLQYLASLTSFE